MSSNLLPRGVPSSFHGGGSGAEKMPSVTLSPTEDLNSTITKVLDANTRLQERLEELEADKRHLQRKLDEYIRFEMEEKSSVNAAGSLGNSKSESLEKEVEHLRKETEKFKSIIGNNSRQDSNYHSLHFQLSELQAARSICVEQHGRQMEMMKLENFRQKEEIERLKRTLQFAGKSGLGSRIPPREGFSRNPYFYGEGGEGAGHTSLPETLPSYSSNSSGYSRKTESSISAASGPTGSSTSLESNSSVAVTDELKKLKRQLDRYKMVNVELDQKLKDANLELQKYAGRGGNWDVAHHMDTGRLQNELASLRAQLDQAQGENSHLRSMVGRSY